MKDNGLIKYLSRMKIWEKGIGLNEAVEKFTVGKDRDLDLYLAEHDVIGNIAHVMMLQKTGLLEPSEASSLIRELRTIFRQIKADQFSIEDTVEDVHSQLELMLTRKLGDSGKKIHSGRSRNDQVLLDLRLFYRKRIREVAESAKELFETLMLQSEKYKDHLMPGYTHLQAAMPSSFGLWFGAYAESLVDDLIMLKAAYQVINQNPLGSAAGYGSSFPIDRKMTTALLGFDDLNYNVIYAQMGRGKSEKTMSYALASVAGTLSKFATDVCLYINQNFNFISLPDEFTTGSSIMPHKKNPDVFELIRAKCNKIQSLPNEFHGIVNNLPSGYFRDLQMLKESALPVFEELINCLEITTLAIRHMIIHDNILADEKYNHIFSVEEVNKKVLSGKPFRDAYKEIAHSIAAGDFKPDREIKHSHEGSIGNLCNEDITNKFEQVYRAFPFKHVEEKINELINDKTIEE